MKSFARLFKENAQFVDAYGQRWTGRERIEAELDASHWSVFRVSRLTANATRVTFLTASVAALTIDWELVRLVSPNGSSLPHRRGILQLILVREAERWQVELAQNTDIIALPVETVPNLRRNHRGSY
jgi:uncharacterized protein (TIGR02246 family)